MNAGEMRSVYQRLVYQLYTDTRMSNQRPETLIAVGDAFARMLHDAWYRVPTRCGALDALYNKTNTSLLGWAIADYEQDLPHHEVTPFNATNELMLQTAQLYAGVTLALHRAGLSLSDYGVLQHALRHSLRALLRDSPSPFEDALRERRNALLARLVGALDGVTHLSGEMEGRLMDFYTEEMTHAYGLSVRTVSDVRSELGGENQ